MTGDSTTRALPNRSGSSHFRAANIAGACAGILIVLCSIVAFVPLAPAFPDGSLDGSWAFALNAAVAKRMVFGRDIVFTFGPYASAYTGLYHPATDVRMLWSSAIFASACASGLIVLTSGWRRWLTVPLACTLVLMPRDTLFLAIPFLLLVLSCRIAVHPDRKTHVILSAPVSFAFALLVVALALLPLVKGTFGAAAGVALGLSLVAVWTRRRFLPLLGAALFAVSLAGFWWVAGQPLGLLPGFFLSLQPIISGYTDAMSVDGPIGQVGRYLLACAALLATARYRLSDAATPGLLLLLGMTLLLFLAFKEGFVRQDGHVFIAAWFLVLVGGIFFIGEGVRLGFAGVGGCLLAAILLSGSSPGVAIATLGTRVGTSFFNAGLGLALRAHGAKTLDTTYAASLSAIRAGRPLPTLDGTVDIYPVEQSAILAQDLGWSPRPVLQSYSAYTPALAALDAAHVAGPSAPDKIIFSVEPFGDRLPAQDDGASWPALLSHYATSTFSGDALVLQRLSTAAASPVGVAPLSDATYRLGQSRDLPIGARPLWADFQVRPTLLGRMLRLAYKPPLLHIEYRYADGGVRRFRYTAGMGEGFLATPVIETTRDFLSLRASGSKDRFTGRHPVSMTISADYGAGWLWQSTYRARLFVLSLPADPKADALLPDPVFVQAERRAALAKTDDCSIDRIDTKALPTGIPEIGSHVRVDGWGAISARNGVLGTSVGLTLTSDSGEVRILPAQRMARPDVNAFFGKPDMGAAGFVAQGEFTVPDGYYSLGVDIAAGGQTWICNRRTRVHIVNR